MVLAEMSQKTLASTDHEYRSELTLSPKTLTVALRYFSLDSSMSGVTSGVGSWATLRETDKS